MSIWDRSKTVADDKETKKSRPIRSKVLHKACQTTSVLGPDRATAFAQDPDHDHELYCAHCQSRFPISTFRWLNE